MIYATLCRRLYTMKSLLLAGILIPLFLSAQTPTNFSNNNPGNPLPSFEPDFINGTVRTIAKQSDGKWIIAGDFSEIGDQPRGRIARLHPDGSLDHSFAENQAGTDNSVTSVAIQPDGKILVAGHFNSINGQPRQRIARLHPDGSLDTDFASHDFGRQPTAALTIALLENGGILIGGNSGNINGKSEPSIVRLHGDGTIDPNFNAENPPGFQLAAIAVQSDGKILIGGNDRSFTSSATHIRRLHPDGSKDETFFTPTLGGNYLNAIALQKDGKIVIGGDLSTPNQPFGIARLWPDGTLDTSFATDLPGISGGRAAQIHALAIQPSGRILVGGGFTHMHGKEQNNLARLNPDGSLDLSFNDENAGPNSLVYTLSLANHPNILIAGNFTKINDLPRRSVGELFGHEPNPDDILLSSRSLMENQEIGTLVGTLTAFASGVPFNAEFALIPGDGDQGNSFFSIDGNKLQTAAIVDRDENVGYTLRIRATDDRGDTVEKNISITVLPAPEKMPSNPGDFDPTFAPPEILTTQGVASIRALALQPDGKILIAGNFTSIGGKNIHRIARLHPDGSLDESFFPGFLETPGSFRPVEAIAVQPDGRILIAGGSFRVHEYRFRNIARLHSDGTVDPSFLGNPYGPSGPNNDVLSMHLQKDGRILIGGYFTAVHGIARNRIARLNSDGTLDTSFGHELEGANAFVQSLAIDTDNRILIGGNFTNVNGLPRNRIARLLENGNLDTSFGHEQTGTPHPVYAITPQPDGKILIGGNFSSINGTARFQFGRLNRNPGHHFQHHSLRQRLVDLPPDRR